MRGALLLWESVCLLLSLAPCDFFLLFFLLTFRFAPLFFLSFFLFLFSIFVIGVVFVLLLGGAESGYV